MPASVPISRADFVDLYDVRFRKIFTEEYKKYHADLVPVFHGVPGATPPYRPEERYSSVSGLTEMGQFTGSIDYESPSLGYDVTGSYVEFAKGMQIRRTALEWDQFSVLATRPKQLARTAFRRRQQDATRHWRNAFAVDTFFYNHSEGVALCSNSHTTTTGASTASGFDNLNTLAFSHANLVTTQIQLADFRDEQNQPIDIVGDTIVGTIDNYDQFWEVLASQGRSSDDSNARNVHAGEYNLILIRNKVDFPDVNDWFLADGTLMKDMVLWFDQVYPGGQPEFGMVEDFDSFVAKWRAYMRYTKMYQDWRWVVGNQVS